MKRIIILVLLFVIISCNKDNNSIPGTDPNPPGIERDDISQYNAKEWDGIKRGGVFYEIFVRSFADSNGDGEGDLNGVTEHLDYLNTGNPKSTTDLKVNGLWMTPIFASPSYHGYDVSNYEEINPKMGTMADFERLIKSAKQRGIAVILDLPFNHTSTENAWFKKALAGDQKYMAYYNWSDTAKQG